MPIDGAKLAAEGGTRGRMDGKTAHWSANSFTRIFVRNPGLVRNCFPHMVQKGAQQLYVGGTVRAFALASAPVHNSRHSSPEALPVVPR